MSSEEKPVSVAVQAVTRLSKATGRLEKADQRLLRSVAEAAKAMLSTVAQDLVANASGAPLLCSKQADGTPMKTVFRHRHQVTALTAVTRSGKAGHDFMMQNQFIRWLSPSGPVTCVLLKEALPMPFGKTAHAQFGACESGWKSLRQLGHRGIAIEHYCWDRCGIDANERLWRQWHAEKAPSFDFMAAIDVPQKVLRLTEFFLCTPCALHDAMSAFRWSVCEEHKSRESLRDIYVAIASLKNSMDLIVRHLPEWIGRHLDFVEPLTMDMIEQRHNMWAALDVELETVEILADTLQLFFAGGRLQVSRDVSDRPDIIDLVNTALLSAWKFVKLSDSRFLTIGSSARPLVVALLTGIEGLVAFIKEDTGKEGFYLGGFSRLSAEHKTAVAEFAFISRVTDGVLAHMLEDARVARNHDELMETLCDDLKWLVDVPPATWEWIAALTSVAGSELRASCMRGAHISFHFFWRRVLQVAEELPWSLVRGDKFQNLADLAAGPKPDEPTSSQLWELLHMGFSETHLVHALDLMADISWSSLTVEQQHGTLASLHRHHPEYQYETLVTRALVLQVRKLLPSESAAEKQLRLVDRALQKASARNPDKAHGRQALVSSLFEHLRSRSWTHSTRVVPEDITTRIFKNHSRIWDNCSLTVKRDFHHIAALRAHDKWDEVRDIVDDFTTQRQLLLSRIEEDSKEHKPLLLSECGLEEPHLQAFDDLLAAFPPGHVVDELHSTALAPLEPLPEDAHMLSQVVYKATNPKIPMWAKPICHNREWFRDCVLVFHEGAGVCTHWKIIYAMANPQYLALSKLVLVDNPFFPASLDSLASPPVASHTFHCNFADNASATGLPPACTEEIFVITDVHHTDGMLMSTVQFPMPLGKFLAQLPDAKEPKEESAAKKQKTGRDTKAKGTVDLVELFPWLIHLDDKEGFAEKVSKRKVKDEDEKQPAREEYDADAEEFVMKAVDEAKAWLSGGEPLRGIIDFKAKPLCGKWLYENTGKGSDAILAEPSGELASKFSQRRIGQKSARWTYNTHEGHNCAIMARAWCHRMQHFFNAEIANPELVGSPFPVAIIASYEEPSEFVKFANSKLKKATVPRVAEIRRLCV